MQTNAVIIIIIIIIPISPEIDGSTQSLLGVNSESGKKGKAWTLLKLVALIIMTVVVIMAMIIVIIMSGMVIMVMIILIIMSVIVIMVMIIIFAKIISSLIARRS